MKLEELYNGQTIPPEFQSKIRASHPSINVDSIENGEIPNTLEDWMASKNWALIDYGWFSDVYVNNDELYVIKINKRLDTGFAWFAFITKKFPNVHFPKISSAKLITVNNQKFYMYAIEKLQRGKYVSDSVCEVCKTAVKLGNNYNEKNDVKKLFTRQTTAISDQTESLFSACMILHKFKKSYNIDLHRNNIMLRNDGTVVIIDPYGGIKQGDN